MWSLYHGHLEMAQYLVSKGADLNAVDKKVGDEFFGTISY